VDEAVPAMRLKARGFDQVLPIAGFIKASGLFRA
jgi:hypothetical protein